jgi:pimeloyl-ACP methyl ester carboxylesterase
MPNTPPLPTREVIEKASETATRVLDQLRDLADVAGRHASALLDPTPAAGTLEGLREAAAAALSRTPARLAEEARAYAVDAAQRWVLFWDVMRQAGNNFVAHEQAGCPPVLVFDYETVLDGRTLPRPVNYALVRIIAPEDYPATDPRLRPFVIIDPRAGHGAGIGGFKSDSQVGVALRRGHPVYFVVFFREPEKGQTILDVTAAEATFLARVAREHPEAPKPVVIGNCQGGWASMMLGAAAPEMVGALVLNGAPLSYWAGEKGRNPMRYLGGLAGGGWPAALMADLGNGKFDGASLVANFESLSPGNTWFRKYFDLYAKVDTEAERFLEFERWWGGYFLMTGDEIRWIVDNLFIGNRFSSGQIASGGGETFNMREVKAPVIVFASAGDNITPPGQALRWIADIYRDEQEIKSLGQTIVYLLHDQIGHLGIFVSGAVARKEHSEIATTLEMIEAVAPGLYEMKITGHEGAGANEEWQVELVERKIADIRALSGEASNDAFPAVAKISEMNQNLYDVLVSPIVRQFSTEAGAEARRQMSPMRMRRYMFSDMNPFMMPVRAMAGLAREHRAPAAPDNPFLAFEKAWADGVERGIDAWRDARDAWIETAFHAIYGGLAALGVTGDDSAAEAEAARRSLALEPAHLAQAREKVTEGGYAEAVIRMMILLADARGGVRRSRLARSNTLLTTEPPFAGMPPSARQAMIREQTMIVTLLREEALAALTTLLPNAAERRKALAAVEHVAGPEEELGERAREMLERMRAVLGLTPKAAVA